MKRTRKTEIPQAVIELGNRIKDIIKEKKPHPLSGMKLILDRNLLVKSIMIQDKELDLNAIYYVATSDYLANGGDNMRFFLTNEGVFDLDYKIRNILIDYFKEVDTVTAPKNIRITEE